MSTPDPRPFLRARCPHCHRALRTCICALAQTVPHEAEVLILMHPLEVHEAKGTGHLLHLCLPRSRVLVGEQWPADALQEALHGDWALPGRDSARHSLLLYPETDTQDAALGLRTSAPLPQPWPCAARQLRLVIIDGTWRKSRKMLYLNPALQALPRLPLHDVPASGYAIRKAQQPGQLSTFEAAALALAQLEGWGQAGQAAQTLARVFESFVAGRMQRPAH
ncbi:MAG: DTW domain-containing protein [Comamonas sp.]|nr:DTW domain-containing protein [Comamonas sp.]